MGFSKNPLTEVRNPKIQNGREPPS